MIQSKDLIYFALTFSAAAVLSGCGNPSSDVMGSKGVPASSSTPAAVIDGTVSMAGLVITCPPTATVGGTATCGATVSGALVSGYWTVDGTKQVGSDNVASYTWSAIPSAGTFKIQGIGYTNDGVMVKSNEISVVVTAPLPLSIVCPATVHVGEVATCKATARIAMVSGYWMIDGVKVDGSDNLVTISSGVLTDANIGLHDVQGVGFDAGGVKYLSNAVAVRVIAR